MAHPNAPVRPLPPTTAKNVDVNVDVLETFEKAHKLLYKLQCRLGTKIDAPDGYPRYVTVSQLQMHTPQFNEYGDTEELSNETARSELLTRAEATIQGFFTNVERTEEKGTTLILGWDSSFGPAGFEVNCEVKIPVSGPPIVGLTVNDYPIRPGSQELFNGPLTEFNAQETATQMLLLKIAVLSATQEVTITELADYFGVSMDFRDVTNETTPVGAWAFLRDRHPQTIRDNKNSVERADTQFENKNAHTATPQSREDVERDLMGNEIDWDNGIDEALPVEADRTTLRQLINNGALLHHHSEDSQNFVGAEQSGMVNSGPELRTVLSMFDELEHYPVTATVTGRLSPPSSGPYTTDSGPYVSFDTIRVETTGDANHTPAEVIAILSELQPNQFRLDGEVRTLEEGPAKTIELWWD